MDVEKPTTRAASVGGRRKTGAMSYAYRNTRGVTYYLHERTVTLAGSGLRQTIRYFGKELAEGAIDAVPASYEIFEGARSTLPLLRKKDLTRAVVDDQDEAHAVDEDAGT